MAASGPSPVTTRSGDIVDGHCIATGACRGKTAIIRYNKRAQRRGDCRRGAIHTYTTASPLVGTASKLIANSGSLRVPTSSEFYRDDRASTSRTPPHRGGGPLQREPLTPGFQGTRPRWGAVGIAYFAPIPMSVTPWMKVALGQEEDHHYGQRHQVWRIIMPHSLPSARYRNWKSPNASGDSSSRPM